MDVVLYYWVIKKNVYLWDWPKWSPKFLRNVDVNDFIRGFMSFMVYGFLPRHFRAVVYLLMGTCLFGITNSIRK